MSNWGLQLNSPVQAPPRTYTWPLIFGSSPSDRHDRALEIVDTIKWVCEDYPDLWSEMGSTLNSYETQSFESMKYLCDRYNYAIEQIVSNIGSIPKPTFPSTRLLQHIIGQVYNGAVTDPEKLNQYEPFSPEVYGETSFDLIAQMIEKLEITENDVFIDLGSGVGQVVLQMAASTPARFCYGIEKAEYPAAYAKAMDSEFRSWMAWYGKKFGSYEIVKGDFRSEDMMERIGQASIIFVNNFAFGPELDHQLKQIFAELKDGTRIVSSKAFCPINFRTTERNMNDIGTMMYSNLLFKPMNECVSWTHKPVAYYLHLIDRAKLQRHFDNNGKYRNGTGNGRSRDSYSSPSSRRKSNPAQRGSRPSKSFDSEDSDETSVTGPTTRRAWSDWVSSRSNGKSSKENSEEDSQSTSGGQNTPSPSKSRGNGSRKGQGKASKGKDEWKPSQRRQGRTTKARQSRNQKRATTSPDITDTMYGAKRRNTSFKGRRLRVEDEEEEDDSAPQRPTPPALVVFLERIRNHMMAGMDLMSSPQYKQQLVDTVDLETRKNQFLKTKARNLEKCIEELMTNSKVQLKARLQEMGIDYSAANVALQVESKVNSVVMRYNDLSSEERALADMIDKLEVESMRLLNLRKEEILLHCKENGTSPYLGILDDPEAVGRLVVAHVREKLISDVKERAIAEDEYLATQMECNTGSSPEAALPLELEAAPESAPESTLALEPADDEDEDSDQGMDSPTEWQTQVSTSFEKIFSYADKVEKRRKSKRNSPRLPESTNPFAPAVELNKKCSTWLDNYVYDRFDAFGLRIPKTPSPSHLIIDEDDSVFEVHSDSNSGHVSGFNRHFKRIEIEYDVPTFLDFDPNPPAEPSKKRWHTWETSESDSARSAVKFLPQPIIFHKTKHSGKSSGTKISGRKSTSERASSAHAHTSGSGHRHGEHRHSRTSHRHSEGHERRRHSERSGHKKCHHSKRSKHKRHKAEHKRDADNDAPLCEQQPNVYPNPEASTFA